MKCILPGQNARILTKAIQSFARIGNELYIEAHQNGLSLRTVNTTRSAFSIITFSPEFFSEYQSTTVPDIDDDLDYENKCKVSVKSCLDVLKNMKQVEICKITINTNTSRLIIQLQCKLETKKTHYISILEQETLSASYAIENAVNKLRASHKLFADIINNFQSNTEELTFELNVKNLIVKNYIEGTHLDPRYMRSQITIQSDEFDVYKVIENTSITFCLKELRSFLYFAESLNLDLIVNFDKGGRPIGFIIKNNDLYEGNLLMATLSPDDVQNECNSVGRPPAVVQNKNKRKRKRNVIGDDDGENNDEGGDSDQDKTIEIDDNTELVVNDNTSGSVLINNNNNNNNGKNCEKEFTINLLHDDDDNNDDVDNENLFNFKRKKNQNKPSIALNAKQSNIDIEEIHTDIAIQPSIPIAKSQLQPSLQPSTQLTQTQLTPSSNFKMPQLNTDKESSDSISVIFQDDSDDILMNLDDCQMNGKSKRSNNRIIPTTRSTRSSSRNSNLHKSNNHQTDDDQLRNNRKMLHKIFKRCFDEPTLNSFEINDNEILANDSDPDE